MRLFDKIASHGLAQETLKADLRSSVVLCADPISQHFWTSKQVVWGNADYPYPKPPWPITFIEWNIPAEILTKDGLEKNDVQQQAMLCRTEDLTQFTRAKWRRNLLDSLPDEVSKVQLSDSMAMAESVCWSVFFSFSRGEMRPLMVGVVWFLSSGGELLDWCARPLEKGTTAYLSSLGTIASEYIRPTVTIGFLAMTFANCSNVKLEDVTEEVAPTDKVRRRLKLPEVKRYTLNIAGHVSRPSRDYNVGPHGVMPFHLCRGHFATYTEEKPLFGKHTGRFWIPPHTRGKKDNGEIVKDYAIVEGGPPATVS